MADNRKTLFLVDAYALIFRAFYAFINSRMLNSSGVNTAPIFGFVLALEDVLQNQKPTHIAVVFDPPGGSFRNQMYKEYKANRDETPDAIIIAVPWIKKIIQAFNIPVIEVPGFEADDVIATLAKKAQDHEFLTYMMTPDKDFMQLVTDNILIFKPAKSGAEPEILGVNEVKAKFGLDQPLQFIDILALMGDSADNVPGAPGIGEKGAVKLIGEFKSLENIYANIESLKGKTKDIFLNNRELIELSKKLVTIDQSAPVEFNEADLEFKGSDIQLLMNIYQELEFKTLLTRLQKTPIIKPSAGVPSDSGTLDEAIPEKSKTARADTQTSLFDYSESQPGFVDMSSLKSASSVPHSYKLIRTADEIKELIKKIAISKELIFNVYGDSADLHAAVIYGISISLSDAEACFVYTYGNDLMGYLRETLENPVIKKIGHNLKYSISVLKNAGINLTGMYFDTMIAHYLIQPDEQHNLEYMASKYLKYKQITDKNFQAENIINFRPGSEAELFTLCEYASEAVDIISQLYRILNTEIENKGLQSLFSTIEMPMVKVLSDIELDGVRIDKSALDEYSKILTAELILIEEQIFKLSGETFNISSPKQLGDILFTKLKIGTATKKTKTKQNSTSEAVLNEMIDLHPIVKEILEYRSIKKLLSTYIDALPKQISKKTGRLHTTFNQAYVATGRLSSTNPNLQNIPIRGERGREIRKAFVPAAPDGFLVSADYSQIELRIMAHLSQDQNMIRAFMNNEDIHTATASKIYNLSSAEVTKEMRNNAKTANFGIIYGISAFGLSQRLSISRQEADKLIQGYFSNFPDVRRYINNSILKARELGYVETLTGRRRYLPEILTANANIRGFAERNAINAPIQGSAADIIKIAMINIHRRFIEEKIASKMILQVHDELVFDVNSTELQKLSEIVKFEMENSYKLSVPLTVDLGSGKNWLEAH